MATDYDSPRKTDDELTEDSLQELQARRMDKSSTAIDVDPDEAAEALELPGADLSNEDLSIRVIPRQADEFTCSSCFLVHHRSQLAETRAVGSSAGSARPEAGPALRCLGRPGCVTCTTTCTDAGVRRGGPPQRTPPRSTQPRSTTRSVPPRRTRARRAEPPPRRQIMGSSPRGSAGTPPPAASKIVTG